MELPENGRLVGHEESANGFSLMLRGKKEEEEEEVCLSTMFNRLCFLFSHYFPSQRTHKLLFVQKFHIIT
jgi:hypothetical protein